MSGRWLGDAAQGRRLVTEYRVLRVDEDGDVMTLFTSTDKTAVCLHAERWLEKWAGEYPDDVLWMEEKEILPWSTALSA